VNTRQKYSRGGKTAREKKKTAKEKSTGLTGLTYLSVKFNEKGIWNSAKLKKKKTSLC